MKRVRRSNAPRITVEEKLMDDQQAQRAKAQIKSMEKQILNYRDKRYPEKPLFNILRRIRYEFGPFGLAVAIAHIKRNQWHRLKDEVKFDVEEERLSLLQERPDLKEQIEEVVP